MPAVVRCSAIGAYAARLSCQTCPRLRRRWALSGVLRDFAAETPSAVNVGSRGRLSGRHEGGLSGMVDIPGLRRQLAYILDLLRPGAALEIDPTWLEPLFGFKASSPPETAAAIQTATRFATERGCSFSYDALTERGRFIRA